MAVTSVGYQQNAADAVPSFMLIGTAKAGTTDLYRQLMGSAANRDAARPEPVVALGVRKELDFLNRVPQSSLGQLFPGAPKYVEYLQELGHPCANAGAATPEGIKACVLERGLQNYTLDATPTYLASVVAPLVLTAISPQTKVIALLRNPVKRAELLFRHFFIHDGKWANSSTNELVDGFLALLRERPAARTALAGLRRCAADDVRCVAAGWRNASSAGLMGSEETKLFTSGLYAYALAAWRLHYLKPGRFMLIDSHTYFHNRAAVMEQVTRFLYGRGLTEAERAAAASEKFERKHSSAVASAGSRWILSSEHRVKLAAFYAVHGLSSFHTLLEGLRKEGAWIVGFDGEPWVAPSAPPPASPKLLRS